jgi:2-polyprenyl-3-methyl-5-hydroxy-6-metoxy-1,4-benzoquinol methylase
VLNGSRNLKGWKNRIKIYLEGLTNQGQFYSRKGMRVLDYGCGAGYSLVEMTELGIECYGIEADPNVKEIGEKLSLALHVGTLDDFPFKHIKFDLIILNQVLEHIANPEALILELKSLLTHDGSIVISVPNANSIYSKLFKSMWINWHIPYHIHHFNKISLAKLIEICDLKIVKAITVTPNLWTKLQLRSLQYIPILGKKNQMWTDEGVANYRKMTKFEEKLFEFEAKSNFGIRKYIIIIINRMIDMLGQGDSILIRVKK